MLLDLLFLILALLPLVPLSRFRWSDAVRPSDPPPSLERCLYMEADEGECYSENCIDRAQCTRGRGDSAPETLTLHPQHS